MLYQSEKELLYKAQQAEGKTFGEIDKSGRVQNERSKGHLGQIIEESFFGYQVNSNSEADFADLGIELKVTPIRKNKNGTLSAKERLVLNIINYMEESTTTFETSSFWRKNKELLLMFYEWIPEIRRADYRIIKSYLHRYAEEDLEIIKQDWQLINEKIRKGLAHELSEADTNYLAACTKGANRSSLREQPFSEVPAMQRAYSLKQSYMTALVRKIILNKELISIASPHELKQRTLLQILKDKFKPFIGKNLNELSYSQGISINYKSKSFLQIFVSNLLGIKGTKLDEIDEFVKANIQLKTVRLEPNGRPEQHMSFKNIDLMKWAVEDWENSWLYNYFSETKILFVVFQYKETKKQNPNRKLYFNGIKLWNMPPGEINGRLKTFWSDVQILINNGIHLEPKIQRKRIIIANNLPKPKSNGLCHIRPKGRNGNDRVPLPDGRMIAKQSFWLDREWVASILKVDEV
ncbi:Sau3AI family type II restriction endonuclease [Sporosarcina saromensis]|uniref:Sau3AI family type II restriction endonuclease n=1 Tax=Sporosarcina saromensis TaxID=359365 RepID=A0ABU4G8G4_9BACL|nr:Sau3AI family type II restriction endonuclease [Sporosarcina saromensis]MDW0113268.1 Sau3AI family type II restriction endonuclease [Sporosarcina saromensis]